MNSVPCNAPGQAFPLRRHCVHSGVFSSHCVGVSTVLHKRDARFMNNKLEHFQQALRVRKRVYSPIDKTVDSCRKDQDEPYLNLTPLTIRTSATSSNVTAHTLYSFPGDRLEKRSIAIKKRCPRISVEMRLCTICRSIETRSCSLRSHASVEAVLACSLAPRRLRWGASEI